MQEPPRSFDGLIRRGSVGPLYAGDREIIRRIFVTVRDRAWREIGPAEWHVSLDAADPRRAQLKARHVAQCVDFAWEGAFKAGEGLKSFSFSFEGEALCDLEVCRVGLVILHPVDFIVGADLTTVTPAGTETFTVESGIYPQEIVNGLPIGVAEPFSRLSVERTDGTCLELAFEGDLFEMEDQRNWADASFKTYCTPLRLGFPRRILAGTRIEQRLEGRLTFARSQGRRRTGNGPEIAPAPAREGRFPSIGRMESDLTPNLPWRHIHVDATAAEFSDRMNRALENSGLPIELGIELGENLTPSHQCRLALERTDRRLVRLVAYGAGVLPPSPQAIGALKQIAQDAGFNAAVLAGTRGYFAELNRGIESKASLDGVAFPLSHTVHGCDEVTIVENVPSITEMAETARRRWHTPNVAVVPLALFYPGGEPDRFPRELIRPWLTATLIEAALAGVKTITLSNDLLETLKSSGDDTIQEVLGPLLEFRGGLVRTVSSASSRDLHAVTLEDAAQGSRYLLAANLCAKAASIVIGDASAHASLEVSGYGVLLSQLA